MGILIGQAIKYVHIFMANVFDSIWLDHVLTYFAMYYICIYSI